MAHNCPDCGYQCHCDGDIDDINFGDWMGCRCCEDKEEDDDDEFDDWYNIMNAPDNLNK